jgi:predicted transcriptional regulator
MTVETDIAQLKVSVDQICKSIDKIDKFILGNGGYGLLDRTTRIEENIRKVEDKIQQLKDDSKSRTELVRSIEKIVETMKDTFLDHVKDPEKHTLKGMITKNAIAYLVLLVVIINTLLPPGLNLFSIIMGALGL